MPTSSLRCSVQTCSYGGSFFTGSDASYILLADRGREPAHAVSTDIAIGKNPLHSAARDSENTGASTSIIFAQARVDGLVAVIQPRAWAGKILMNNEDSGITTDVVVATDVTPDDYAALVSRIHHPVSMRYNAASGKIVICDLPLARHEIPVTTPLDTVALKAAAASLRPLGISA